VKAAFESNDFDSVEWKLENSAWGNRGFLLLPQRSELLEFHWQRAPEGAATLPAIVAAAIGSATGKGFCSDT